VWAEEAAAGAAVALGQIGEGHAVLGEHDVDLIGEGFHHISEEGGAFHFRAQSWNSTEVNSETRSMGKRGLKTAERW